MRVFVTGASGMIGSGVVRELIGAGHKVLGLARSEQSAKVVEELGAEAHRGDITDASCLVPGVAACEGAMHLAHDNGNGTPPLPETMAVDRKAIATNYGYCRI